jgi:hypothetical protein
MGTTRLTISIEDIDTQVAELRRQAAIKEKEAHALTLEAVQLQSRAKRLGELKELALEVGTPATSSRPRVSRVLQIANFIWENGPQTRKAIIEKTGIPEGTINSEMRDREVFCEVGGNLWSVTEEFRAKHNKQTSLVAANSQEEMDEYEEFLIDGDETSEPVK